MKTSRHPITDPIDRNQNPARRGGHYDSPLSWPTEFLSKDERRREVWLLGGYYAVFACTFQLAAGTIPGSEQYRAPMMIVALFLAFGILWRVPLFIPTCIGLSPFCLLLPWHTEFLWLRAAIGVCAPIYAAYQFRQHLITFASASPLPASAAKEFREHGVVADSVSLDPMLEGTVKGFCLALSSWFTYLGNEQRLPTVYRSPAGVWYSRTFLTALGIFGMIFILPHETILIVLASMLVLIHPVLILLAFPLQLLGPVLAMLALAFCFVATRARGAWSLKQHASLENTVFDLMNDLNP